MIMGATSAAAEGEPSVRMYQCRKGSKTRRRERGFVAFLRHRDARRAVVPLSMDGRGLRALAGRPEAQNASTAPRYRSTEPYVRPWAARAAGIAE